MPQLGERPQHLLDEVWVSLDLETTGLSPEKDEIIEIGAVKFQGQQVLDTLQTLVNPHRLLNGFIKELTGITQSDLNGAPPFSEVAGDLFSFIGHVPILGHNIGFDLEFLDKTGLRFNNPRCDTWDLAYVLYPGLRSYSLAGLSDFLGVTRPRTHRALDDAQATREVFLRLLKNLSELDSHVLAEMQRIASHSPWILSYLLGRMAYYRVSCVNPSQPDTPLLHPGSTSLAKGSTLASDPFIGDGIGESRLPGERTRVGIPGLDVEGLSRRLRRDKTLRPTLKTTELDVAFVESLLSEGGDLINAMSEFEERPQQVAMARAVAKAINNGGRLMVEAGTGVGKSLAYLLPAALYALLNNRRVVVSTNTINLQEQLLNKDIPILVQTLSRLKDTSLEGLKFTQLKGRVNYLCFSRWLHQRFGESLTESEARLLSKTLVWMQTTTSGDRSELNLAHRSASAPWDRLSAQGSMDCLSRGGPCFLRAAREKAAASHLVIVNHALLLSDLTTDGMLIPDYDVLIVDEAHHLEGEATRHLGFELSQSRFDEHLRSLSGERGLFNQAAASFRNAVVAATRRSTLETATADTLALLPRVRDHMARLFAKLETELEGAYPSDPHQRRESRITQTTRTHPGWSELEIQWENVDVCLYEVSNALHKFQIALEGLENTPLLNSESLLLSVSSLQQINTDIRNQLSEFMSHPKQNAIYWVTRSAEGRDLILHSAPLEVGQTLDAMLYSQKESVILTSATLSTNDTFDHIRERTGFSDTDELLLGSPFDYPNAALLCVPEDMPEPTSMSYEAAAHQAINDVVLAVNGGAMALFTSHASLQATSTALRDRLQPKGVTVLAQGIDGTPSQLAQRFLNEPNALLLGTSSFWEGVDFAGDSLKALLVMRLPFSVPSEPVFAARSELYEDSFNDYAMPHAVLRLRQGFGRLIRTRFDRGVAVILDRRILSRKYGRVFLNSLPPMKLNQCRLRDLRSTVLDWMETQ